jgi:hypothetical protein
MDLGLEQRVAGLRKAGKRHLFPHWYRQGQKARQLAEVGAKREGNLRLDCHDPRLRVNGHHAHDRVQVDGITIDLLAHGAVRHTPAFVSRLATAGALGRFNVASSIINPAANDPS